MLKKSFCFIILIVIIIFTFTSCTKSNYSWDDVLNDVNLLQEKNMLYILKIVKRIKKMQTKNL